MISPPIGLGFLPRRNPLPSLRDLAFPLSRRHRTLFWMLHSAWALTSGIVIVLFARERYHLVLWVVLFLALTWASTLYFGRAVAQGSPTAPAATGFVHALTSYGTRVLYQETLFFLLPFYWSSTVFGSPNACFLVLLGALAVLSCIDLLFDRWLRASPVFALLFFTVVAFAAVNLLLPVLLGLRPHFATPVAALMAVASAVPIARRTMGTGLGVRIVLGVAGALLLVLPVGFPVLIPPVPLRLEHATFSSGIDRATLALADSLQDHVATSSVGPSLFVLVEVFAPSSVPTSVQLEWWRGEELIRVSREVSITAHAAGFRLWDGWHPTAGVVPPGRYRVMLRTFDRRMIGVAKLTVDP